MVPRFTPGGTRDSTYDKLIIAKTGGKRVPMSITNEKPVKLPYRYEFASDELKAIKACHDAHGISRLRSSAGDHTNLINFDLSIVQPVDADVPDRIKYEDTGRLSGNCTLRCHSVNHVGFPYAG